LLHEFPAVGGKFALTVRARNAEESFPIVLGKRCDDPKRLTRCAREYGDGFERFYPRQNLFPINGIGNDLYARQMKKKKIMKDCEHHYQFGGNVTTLIRQRKRTGRMSSAQNNISKWRE